MCGGVNWQGALAVYFHQTISPIRDMMVGAEVPQVADTVEAKLDRILDVVSSWFSVFLCYITKGRIIDVFLLYAFRCWVG